MLIIEIKRIISQTRVSARYKAKQTKQADSKHANPGEAYRPTFPDDSSEREPFRIDEHLLHKRSHIRITYATALPIPRFVVGIAIYRTDHFGDVSLRPSDVHVFADHRDPVVCRRCLRDVLTLPFAVANDDDDDNDDEKQRCPDQAHGGPGFDAR